jgi:Trypsin
MWLAVTGVIACGALTLLVPAGAAAAIEPDPGTKVAPGVFLASAAELAGGDSKSGAAPAEDGRWSRIVGGDATTIEEWPWQAAVTENPALYAGNAFDRRFCGGSLVAPTIVITAAHCTFEVFGSSGFDDPVNFASVTGRTTLTNNAQGQESAWADFHFFVDASGNPLYNPNTSEWDVVFAELANPSPSGTIKIAGLDEAASWAPADENAWATGWGSTMSGGPQQNTLREVNLDILADSVCGSPTSYGSGFVPETMLCAGEVAGLQDTCQGDSGGPLVVPIGGGTFRLVGDTSFGLGCALPNFPGVYGRVAQDPMCSALQTGIQAEAGVDVVGTGGCQPAPAGGGGGLETVITKGPKDKTKKKKATFEFTGAEVRAIAGFQCSLDGKAFASCTSPHKVKVKKGRHTFQVRTVDTAGNVDGTPASDSWKRKKKKKKK